jgi:hypothetical protein
MNKDLANVRHLIMGLTYRNLDEFAYMCKKDKAANQGEKVS